MLVVSVVDPFRLKFPLESVYPKGREWWKTEKNRTGIELVVRVGPGVLVEQLKGGHYPLFWLDGYPIRCQSDQSATDFASSLIGQSLLSMASPFADWSVPFANGKSVLRLVTPLLPTLTRTLFAGAGPHTKRPLTATDWVRMASTGEREKKRQRKKSGKRGKEDIEDEVESDGDWGEGEGKPKSTDSLLYHSLSYLITLPLLASFYLLNLLIIVIIIIINRKNKQKRKIVPKNKWWNKYTKTIVSDERYNGKIWIEIINIFMADQ